MRIQLLSGRLTRLFVVAALVAALTPATVLLADDFWLVPDVFALAPGDALEVRGQTSSTFPTSKSAVAPDRVADARVIGAGGDERISDLSRSGTSLVLRHRPTVPGQRVVVVSLHPRASRESVAGFRRYLELEGAADALARIDREGLLGGRDSVTRRYAKYAKALVEVGRGGPRAFDRVAGLPLEFVPLADPEAARAGDTLALRLLYRGRALAGAHVHAGGVAWPAIGPAASASSSHASATRDGDAMLTTDSAGVVRVPLSRSGLWNARIVHIVRADAGSGADWDTHWASVVFRVGRDADERHSQDGDSSEVARTVRRFHEALQAGDSAAALSLLAPDVTILESGGAETRAEYRAHHLAGDIAFARAVRSVPGPMLVTVRGDVAWASSTSSTRGKYRERAINSANAELMVLVRGSEGWRIAAIHWSSRAGRP